jgi:hypothetical protein
MVVNRTIRDPRRTVTARFPVALTAPIADARAALLEAIAETPGTTPGAARVVIAEITDRMVWLEAIAYGPIDAVVVALASELRERGLAALAEKGFLAA